MRLQRWLSALVPSWFELPNVDANTLNSELAAFDAELDDFAEDYRAEADGKAGIQKGMDAVRWLFNRGDDGRGYGDDQFKNIANTQHGIDQLQADVKTGRLDEQEAQRALAQLRHAFASEADRVEGAQAVNARVGKAAHGAGRIVAVGAAGIAGTLAGGGGNVVAGAAAAVAAGSAYDALTVGAGSIDKKLGHGGNTDIAPALDTNQSIGGLAASALAGQKVEAKDVVQAAVGTALDAVSGGYAGQGIKAARAGLAAAHRVAQRATGDATACAGGMALAKAAVAASAANSARQTAASLAVRSAGTIADPSLNQQDKVARLQTDVRDTLVALPGQLAAGAASSGFSAAVTLPRGTLDGLTQWSVDAAADVAATSVGNAAAGHGAALTKEQWVTSTIASTTGALHNVKQRVEPQDAGLLHGLNPYFGPATPDLPLHPDGPSVVLHSQGYSVVQRDAPQTNVPLDYDTNTQSLWTGSQRDRLGAAIEQHTPADGAPHLYRTFEHLVSGQRLFLPMALEQPYPADRAYQGALRNMLDESGFQDMPVPLLQLVDETPVGVLQPDAADLYALNMLRAASAVGANRHKLQMIVDELPSDWSRVRWPSEWMHHFAMGSGNVKTMSAEQVHEALPAPMRPRKGTEAQALNELWLARLGLSAQRVLDGPIAAQRAQGMTHGDVQASTSDHVFKATAGAWFYALGHAHVFGLYKGRWQDNGDGRIHFEGERHWLVQDRYNWAAAGFNGLGVAPVATNVPALFGKLLPPSYQASLTPSDYERARFLAAGASAEGLLSNSVFAHLQMLESGAKPFWTLGVGEAQAVSFTWTPLQVR
jgi:hypothetical protein